MIKSLYDFAMFSLVSLVKLSMFAFLFIFAMFFVVKSKDMGMADKPAYAGLLTDPGSTGHLKGAEEEKEEGEEQITDSSEPEIEDMTAEEAEVFLFVLRLSDDILPQSARKLARIIVEECENSDLDPYLILAVIQIESEFSPGAVSKRGAIGLMQVMPGTGEYIAKEMGIEYGGRKSLYDPFINVRLGIRYLSSLEDRYDTTENALNAYNFGPTNFEKRLSANNIPSGYVKKVLNFKSYLEEESILLAKNS